MKIVHGSLASACTLHFLLLSPVSITAARAPTEDPRVRSSPTPHVICLLPPPPCRHHRLLCFLLCYALRSCPHQQGERARSCLLAGLTDLNHTHTHFHSCPLLLHYQVCNKSPHTDPLTTRASCGWLLPRSGPTLALLSLLLLLLPPAPPPSPPRPVTSGVLGVPPRPVLSALNRRRLVRLPQVRHVVVQGVVGVGRGLAGWGWSQSRGQVRQALDSSLLFDPSIARARGRANGNQTCTHTRTRRAWMERSTVRIWRAGDHLSLRMSRQIRPSLSIFGWYILVRNRTYRVRECVCVGACMWGSEAGGLRGGSTRQADRLTDARTLGGAMGYSAGRNSSSLKVPSVDWRRGMGGGRGNPVSPTAMDARLEDNNHTTPTHSRKARTQARRSPH